MRHRRQSLHGLLTSEVQGGCQFEETAFLQLSGFKNVAFALCYSSLIQMALPLPHSLANSSSPARSRAFPPSQPAHCCNPYLPLCPRLRSLFRRTCIRYISSPAVARHHCHIQLIPRPRVWMECLRSGRIDMGCQKWSSKGETLVVWKLDAAASGLRPAFPRLRF